MRAYDRERQEWAGGRRQRLYHPDQYLDLPRQRRILERTGAVLAAVGLCFGFWAFTWKDEPEPGASMSYTASGEEKGGQSAQDDSTPGEPDPGESDPEEADPTGTETGTGSLPDGFTEVQDDEGFRVALPDGWQRESSPSQHGIDVVNYRSPDGLRRLQIFQLMEATPYASLQDAVTETRKLDGYERIGLAEIPSAPDSAAEHEYRASEIAGETGTGVRHVIDHRFEAADGNLYALVAYGPDNPDNATTTERELVDTAAAWFCPPYTTCPTP